VDHDDLSTPWRRSSYSNSGANCVEIAKTRSGKIAVRDSKDPEGGALRFSQGDWRAFLAGFEPRPLTHEARGPAS